ncbi:MAG TPA: hypothetical protein VMW03_07820 [Candidatus Krumholzibacteriaceae bacterium]|nr:hypothetical protein [Candidatus Krumholzibacteriaceae bacterium]
MNLRKLTLRYMGWCPGYDSASRFVPDRDIGGRAVAAAFTAVMLIIIFSPAFNGLFRFALMVVTAFIGVPATWIAFRGEKAGYQKGTYPDPSVKPTPSERFGEFKIDGPLAEAPVYGPTRSSLDYYTDMTMEREWLHPDILKLRELQEEEEESREERV